MASGGDGSSQLGSSVQFMAEKKEKHDDEELDDEENVELEPFFYDEAAAVADHERRMRREQDEAKKKEERDRVANARMAARAKILDYDPKQGGKYYNRFHFDDLGRFDLDEESPLDPMRYTDTVRDRVWELTALNILSVKIASLDVDFPINVYGTVIARDSIDFKCIYLFRREKDHCQIINSKDESLILTGPKRGLLLLDDAYVETDLKITDHQGEGDEELSKGFLTIRSIAGRYMGKSIVERKDLATRLSTLEVTYAVVDDALEATISAEVMEAEFHGKISACTTSIPDHLVLYESKLVTGLTKTKGHGKGFLQLLRPVVSVGWEEKLLVTIVAKTGGGDIERQDTIAFTPRYNGGDGAEVTLGITKILVKVVWSVLRL